MRRLLDEIGSPFLKVTIDAVNLFHAGELPRMKEILDEAFALVGQDVVLRTPKIWTTTATRATRRPVKASWTTIVISPCCTDVGSRGPLLLHGLSECRYPAAWHSWAKRSPASPHQLPGNDTQAR